MYIPEIKGPDIYGSMQRGIQDRRKSDEQQRQHDARNALQQAVQSGGLTSPEALNALAVLDPNAAISAQMGKDRMGQDARQFDERMGFQREEFDYRKGMDKQRMAQAAAARRSAQITAEQDRRMKVGGAMIGQVLALPEDQRPEAWKRTLQLAASQGFDTTQLNPEYPGEADAAALYSFLSGEIYEPKGGPEWRPTTDEEAAQYGRVGQINTETGQYKAGPGGGMSITSDGQGGFSVTTGGAPEAFGTKAGNDLDAAQIDSASALGRLARINELYKPEYQEVFTRAGNAIARGKDKLGMASPEEQQAVAEFAKYKAAAMNDMNLTIKELAGAAVSASEEGRLYAARPNAGTGVFDGDSPAQFKAKLDEVTRATRLALARAQWWKQQGNAGKIVANGELAPGVPALTQMPRIIHERETEIRAALREQGFTDEASIREQVRAQLNAEFGL